MKTIYVWKKVEVCFWGSVDLIKMTCEKEWKSCDFEAKWIRDKSNVKKSQIRVFLR